MDESPVDPANPDILDYWVTPGGGVEKGETFEEALKRELLEEIGLDCVNIERTVGRREVVLDLPHIGRVMSHEKYFFCRLEIEKEINHERMSLLEKRVFRTAKWWDLDDLVGSGVIVRPPRLFDLLTVALASNFVDEVFLDE